MSEAVWIQAVNLDDRLFLLEDDTVGHITDLLDEDGEQTTDMALARAAVGYIPGDSWVSFSLSGFESTRVH